MPYKFNNQLNFTMRKLVIILSLFMVFNLLDICTTWYGIRTGIAKETNPLFAHFNTGGISVCDVLQAMGGGLAVCLVYVGSYLLAKKIENRVLMGIVYAGSFVIVFIVLETVVNNLVVILGL
jgi:hypothetical protein